MKKLAIVGLVLLAGCASPPPPAFSLSLEAALERAKAEEQPLLVLSVVGELDGRL